MLKNIFKKPQSFLNTRDWLVLAGGLAVFAFISLCTIANSSVWFDEAFGAYLIRFDFWHIATYTAADVHPPFYYWLLKLWSMLFGTSEFALRSMSVLFAGVAITFAFLLTKRLFGRKAAWVGLLFMVLSPMFIRYGQEMRMYTLVAAIAFAATYVLVLATETKKRALWIVYGALLALGMWTHYFTALVWLAHWVWRSLVIGRGAKNMRACLLAFFTKDWILAYVVAVVTFLPWMPFLLRQIFDVQVNGFWIGPVTPATVPNFLTNVLFYLDIHQVQSWAALAFVAIGLLAIVLAVRLFTALKADQRVSYLLLFSLAFVPIILLFVASMPPLRPSFVDRYLIPSSLAIPLFIGVTLALSTKFMRPALQKAAAALVVCVMVVGIYNVYQLGNYNKTLHSSNNTRQIIEAIEAKTPNTQPIIADSPWLFYEAVFYDTAKYPVYFNDASTEYRYGSLKMLKENDQHKIKDLAAFAKVNPVVWYVGRPGTGELNPPNSQWKALQRVEVNDSISGQPAYRAIQFQTNAE